MQKVKSQNIGIMHLKQDLVSLLLLGTIKTKDKHLILIINYFHRFLFRLYWFPLKVLYSTGVASIYRTLGKETHRYTLFNILLWILLVLNLYWLFVSCCFILIVILDFNLVHSKNSFTCFIKTFTNEWRCSR